MLKAKYKNSFADNDFWLLMCALILYAKRVWLCECILNVFWKSKDRCFVNNNAFVCCMMAIFPYMVIFTTTTKSFSLSKLGYATNETNTSQTI
jgi:cbb3-type cytochrome oxidase subunit 1